MVVVWLRSGAHSIHLLTGRSSSSGTMNRHLYHLSSHHHWWWRHHQMLWLHHRLWLHHHRLRLLLNHLRLISWLHLIKLKWLLDRFRNFVICADQFRFLTIFASKKLLHQEGTKRKAEKAPNYPTNRICSPFRSSIGLFLWGRTFRFYGGKCF